LVDVVLQDEVPAALMDAHFKNVEASSTDGKFDPSAGLAQVCICFLNVITELFLTAHWTSKALLLEGHDLSLCWYVETTIPLPLISLTTSVLEIQLKCYIVKSTCQ
jgi:hypothetical protein